MLAATASLALWHLKRDAVESQRRELGLLSLALTDAIDRGLRGAEEGLYALRGELRQGGMPVKGNDAMQALHVRARLMPLVQTIWVVDRKGQVIAASDATLLPDLGSFAPALDGLPADAVSMSRPFNDPRDREPMLALAVPLQNIPGHSGGWIVGAMPAKSLLGALSAALSAADARVQVLRADGARLSSENVGEPTRDEASMARSLANRPLIEVRKFRNGRDNLVAVRSVPRFDVKVLLSRDLGTALQSWREAAEGAVIALGLLFAIMAAAVQLVLRANRKRSEAQRALSAQLIRATRLESLGTLAGGVAHDFNNVLAGIIGFGEMAQDGATPGTAQARHLDKVLKAAQRGKALVERILAFSKGGARVSTVFELESVIEEVLTLLSASLRPGVVLERILEAPGAHLRGDPTQAFEAVMNLCTNAMQAMPQGGMLSVQLRREQVGSARVLSHSALAAGDYLALVVSDQGGGITPDVMEHLFEPFFTTRGAQSGTGLGLAVVHGVVAEFGGAIDVKSTPGQGARFTLYFPESFDAAAAPKSASDAAPVGAGQTVLVVDDEPTLVGLVEELLQGLGYAPVGFTSSADALQALREDPTRYAAVITDEVMPRLSGTQLTEALRAFAPSLPVLLLTGYGGAQLAQRAAAAGVSRVLSKPLQRGELARVLADVLR